MTCSKRDTTCIRQIHGIPYTLESGARFLQYDCYKPFFSGDGGFEIGVSGGFEIGISGGIHRNTYNRLILNANEDINDLCLINSINLLVSPLDILSPADVCAIETAYSFLDKTQCNNRLIVNYNHHLEFSGVSYDEFIRRMKPWMNYLYPQTLPKVYGQLLVTQGTGRLPIALQSTDLEYRYQDLSITILDQLGIKSYDEPIENLSFYDLVDRLS